MTDESDVSSALGFCVCFCGCLTCLRSSLQTKTHRIGSEITLKLIKQIDITYQDLWTAPVKKVTQMNNKKGKNSIAKFFLRQDTWEKGITGRQKDCNRFFPYFLFQRPEGQFWSFGGRKRLLGNEVWLSQTPYNGWLAFAARTPFNPRSARHRSNLGPKKGGPPFVCGIRSLGERLSPFFGWSVRIAGDSGRFYRRRLQRVRTGFHRKSKPYSSFDFV
ncbi:hypothetical protein QQF64_023720 [Cirrhinus molitorella]|uniref:Uncharacterized protein n=1 Tax=Cirrhinus molitorella TaxID=172907 RepID=A0ABR3NJV3_9TELE